MTQRKKGSTENTTFTTSTGALAPVLVGGFSMGHPISAKKKSENLDWRNDLMTEEILSRVTPSRAKDQKNRTRKRKDQEEEPHFYGGVDMYDGPFGPPEED